MLFPAPAVVYQFFGPVFTKGLRLSLGPYSRKVLGLKLTLRLDLSLRPGPVFTKGLRLSQVLGLNVVLKLKLLSQLSFVLNPYSQKGT